MQDDTGAELRPHTAALSVDVSRGTKRRPEAQVCLSEDIGGRPTLFHVKHVVRNLSPAALTSTIGT